MTTQELMFQILMKEKFSPELSEVGDEFVVWEIDCGWVGVSLTITIHLYGVNCLHLNHSFLRLFLSS